MKKLLSILGTTSLVAVSSATVIACGAPPKNGTNPDPETDEPKSLEELGDEWGKANVTHRDQVRHILSAVGKTLFGSTGESWGENELYVYQNNENEKLDDYDYISAGQTYLIKPRSSSKHFKDSYSFTLNRISLEDGFIEYHNSNNIGLDISKNPHVLLNNWFKPFDYNTMDGTKQVSLETNNRVDGKYFGYGTQFTFRSTPDSTVFIENDTMTITWDKRLDPQVFLTTFFNDNSKKLSRKSIDEFYKELNNILERHQKGLTKYLNRDYVKIDETTLDNNKIKSGTRIYGTIQENEYFSTGEFNVNIK